jgi:hypothetical protein
VNPDAYEGIPETLEAGRYLVTANVSADIEGGSGVAFLQPRGMAAEEFLTTLGGGSEDEAVPAFVYQATFAGGASGLAGGTGSAVIDLTEGEWIAWGDDPEAPQAPVIFTVTGEFPVEVAEPEADITFTLVDFGIMVEGNLTAGEHIVKIDNQGAQPHFVDLSMVPEGTTDEDIAALLNADMTGTPVTDGLGEDDFQWVTYTPTQSIDVQVWTTLTLEAGTYNAACWFPTAGVGDPHAFHGMHTVFEVS